MNRNTLTYTTKPAYTGPKPPVIQPDKYDEAIAYLTEHPEEISKAWNQPGAAKGGCLFRMATNAITREDTRRDVSLGFGCLTMVRGNGCNAATPELTIAIRSDGRIPSSRHTVTPSHLPVFAEWQRRLDVELGRP